MPEMVGIAGDSVPWKKIEGAGMLAESFGRLGAKIVDGKLVRSGGLPPPSATAELFFLDPNAVPDGSGSFLLLLPVTNVEDFRVFTWLFEERGVADDEEVLVSYLPAPGLFSGGKARFGVAVSRKGTLKAEHAALRRGETPIRTEPIWIHEPRTPFTKPQT